jgi:hypothetical protein
VTTTLKEVPENDMLVMLKGTDDMQGNDDDNRLTPVQREIRDRCGNVPKRIRRSIDAYRVARGMVPLWSSSPQQQRQRRA